jgi:hypothetical protein
MRRRRVPCPPILRPRAPRCRLSAAEFDLGIGDPRWAAISHEDCHATLHRQTNVPRRNSPADRCRGREGRGRRNAERGVTWIHSYVVEDRGTTFCIYDGPDPQAVRDVAGANGLPCDAVTAVSVLDPYFYRG